MGDVRGRPLKILVADDARTVRGFLAQALNDGDFGVEVQEAQDGAECYRHLASGLFDIAFVDVNMPGMDGLTAVARARDAGARTFIVIMSTESDRARLETARELRAYEYLSKPFDAGDIQMILHNYERLQIVSRVLVVDDSSVARKVIRRVLEQSFLQFAYDEAADGRNALERLERDQFDLVFLDVNMPGLSGFDVARSLHTSNSKITTIMMTSERSTLVSLKAQSLRIQNVLYKPFFPQDVDICLHEVFGLQAPELNGNMEAVESA